MVILHIDMGYHVRLLAVPHRWLRKRQGHRRERRQHPHCSAASHNGAFSVYRLREMPMQSRGQSVSASRGGGGAGARLSAHTELRTKRQRSAREAIDRNRPIETTASKIWK